MNSYLAYMVAQAEHRARIERVERFGHLHRDPPRRLRPPRPPVGLRPWRSRRPVVSPAPATPVTPALAADGVAIESPGGGPLLADISPALNAYQTVT